MAQQAKYSWLDEFLESIERTLGFMDLSTLQPTSWRHFQPLIAKEWLEWFKRIPEQQKNQGVPIEKVAKSIPSDMIREGMLFLFEDLKTANWPKEKRLEIAEFFYKMQTSILKEDYFGLKGTNKKHSKEEVLSIMEKNFVPGTPEAARELGKLYNAAYNLGAALFLDFYMGAPIENYGPYELGDNQILVIKEMRFLRSKEVWPKRDTIANNAVMYSVYENVKFSLDLICCHSRIQGDAINGLKKWRLEKDGKQVTDLKEVKELMMSIAKNSSEQWQELLALPEPELLEKAVWIRCYLYKGVCDLLGIDWKPTPELLNSVKGKTLQQGWKRWKQPKTEKAFKEYWRKVLDPRIDFYG